MVVIFDYGCRPFPCHGLSIGIYTDQQKFLASIFLWGSDGPLRVKARLSTSKQIGREYLSSLATISLNKFSASDKRVFGWLWMATREGKVACKKFVRLSG